MRRLTGSDIRPEHWDAFYDFYMDTASRKWGHPYLNRTFFEELGARLADRILLVMAFRDGAAVMVIWRANPSIPRKRFEKHNFNPLLRNHHDHLV